MSERVHNEAAGLFDLFREFKTYEIKDPRGRSVTVGLRALDYYENTQIIEGLEPAREKAQDKYDNDKQRAAAKKTFLAQTPEQVIEQIIIIEKATVAQNTDLAPQAPDDALAEEKFGVPYANLTDAQKEDIVLAKWESERRADLAKYDHATNVDRLIDLQIRSLVMVSVAEMLVKTQLAFMVQEPLCPECAKRATMKDDKWVACRCGKWPSAGEVDPQPNWKPYLSANEKDANSVDRLMPQTRQQLNDLRTRFLSGQSEKDIRKVAEAPAFLPSGESPSDVIDSHGETTETLSVSPTA